MLVVTGGASGNGRAIAQRFAEEGAAGVVVADLQPEPREGGDATTARVESAGAKALYVQCDVSNPDDLVGAVAAAEEFGGVTVMVNNAGIMWAQDFLEVSPERYDRLMDVNVKGVFFGSQAAARSMVQRGASGAIVNIASVASFVGSGPVAAYCAAKGAVRLLTLSLADALGPHGIRVNGIYPGLVDTEMARTDMGLDLENSARACPLGRNASPRDVADAAVYLASDMASYVNGASLLVDGGRVRA